MKVSSSARPDIPDGSRRASAPPWPVSAIALAYLALHLPFLAPNLEDVDSINFALGLRDFDPGRHQPHPPGYPVYIALGRVSLFLVSTIWSSLSQTAAEATALALWSALGGAVAIVALFHLFRELNASVSGLPRRSGSEGGPRRSLGEAVATALAAAAP